MEEIFREYGGAVLAMLGGIAVMGLVAARLFRENGGLAQVLQTWGLGGV